MWRHSRDLAYLNSATSESEVPLAPAAPTAPDQQSFLRLHHNQDHYRIYVQFKLPTIQVIKIHTSFFYFFQNGRTRVKKQIRLTLKSLESFNVLFPTQ